MNDVQKNFDGRAPFEKVAPGRIVRRQAIASALNNAGYDAEVSERRAWAEELPTAYQRALRREVMSLTMSWREFWA